MCACVRDLQSAGVDGVVTRRMAGWMGEEERGGAGGGGGGGNTMHDLLVWHYWAIPHRETQRGEEDGGINS